MNKVLKTALKKTYPVKWFLGKISNLEKIQKDQLRQIQSLKKQNNELRRQMNYLYYKGLRPDQYPEALKEWYKWHTGKTLNLEHPKTYNEKIQWLKLYDSTPLKTRLADKYLVRDWVSEKIGSQYLIPLLGVYDKFDDINFDELPDKFVLKTNHASGTNRIVTDKSKFDIKEAREFFNKKMRINYAFWSGLELHYKDIVPKIVVEANIAEPGDDLQDYKFYCFNGDAKYVVVDSNRFVNHRRDCFDLNWNHLDVVKQYPNADVPPSKPEDLEEMTRLANVLSQGIGYVRVDLYDVKGRIYFGEMTFTDGSGQEKITPEEFDRTLGDLIDLPKGRQT